METRCIFNQQNNFLYYFLSARDGWVRTSDRGNTSRQFYHRAAAAGGVTTYSQSDDLVEEHDGGHVEVEDEILKQQQE
jgi:hypothetical protein